MIADVVQEMVLELGYTEAEAWERVSDELLYRLEEHFFDPPSLEESIQLAEFMAGVKFVDMTKD